MHLFSNIFFFRRELKLDRVDSIVRAIASNYKTFEFYQELADQIDRHTLQDFATSVTSHGFGSIRFNLNELHSLVAPKDGILGNVGIFELLSNGVEVSRLLSARLTSHLLRV